MHLKTSLYSVCSTSPRFRAEATNLGKLSFPSPGTPTDNPGQESFFGRFKDEWRDEINELKSFEEVKKFVEDEI